ncbi:MAG: glycosyl transferase family 28 [Actinomycetia bacterium]|nr:glycosyl transferase family 28 [Actinomycetes bacterium]
MTAQVFVSVGTDHHPFDRLVGWVDRWQKGTSHHAEVFVQRGTSLTSSTVESIDYLDKDELDARLASAAVVVSHGGPSTIMGARGSGIRPIVVARDHTRGEHVDGHQMAFCEHLEKYGLIIRARTEEQLHALIDDALENPSMVRLNDGDHDDLIAPTLERFESMVDGLLGRRPGLPGLGASSAA